MWKLFGKKINKYQSVIIKINGMHCSSCSLNIEAALEELPQVAQATASYARGEVGVEYIDSIDLDQVYTAIESLGYTVDKEKK